MLAGFAFVNPGETDIAVTRLNANGSSDQGFGDGGTALINYSTSGPRTQDFANAVAIQPDGKIWWPSARPHDLEAIVRLNVNGSLDTSFGLGWWTVPASSVRAQGRANDVAIDPSGKIATVGSYNFDTHEHEPFFERLEEPAAEIIRRRQRDVRHGRQYGARCMAIRSDGGVIVAGFRQDTAGDEHGGRRPTDPWDGVDGGPNPCWRRPRRTWCWSPTIGSTSPAA